MPPDQENQSEQDEPLRWPAPYSAPDSPGGSPWSGEPSPRQQFNPIFPAPPQQTGPRRKMSVKYRGIAVCGGLVGITLGSIAVVNGLHQLGALSSGAQYASTTTVSVPAAETSLPSWTSGPAVQVEVTSSAGCVSWIYIEGDNFGTGAGAGSTQKESWGEPGTYRCVMHTPWVRRFPGSEPGLMVEVAGISGTVSCSVSGPGAPPQRASATNTSGPVAECPWGQ